MVPKQVRYRFIRSIYYLSKLGITRLVSTAIATSCEYKNEYHQPIQNGAINTDIKGYFKPKFSSRCNLSVYIYT
jgi:hypothetical protein